MYKGGKLLIRILAIMMVLALLLAYTGFAAPQFSVAEWYCYNQLVQVGIETRCPMPCGVFAGMSPWYSIMQYQLWCCNAYTCWPEKPPSGPFYYFFGGCAFC